MVPILEAEDEGLSVRVCCCWLQMESNWEHRSIYELAIETMGV